MQWQELKNNFNLIRLAAATQVLVIHACNHLGYDSTFIKCLKCFPGVPLFFFISGYLIGGTYIKKFHLGLSTFFQNRLLRLYPALIVCTIVSLLLVYISGYFQNLILNKFDFSLWVLSQVSFFQFYNPGFMRSYGVGVLNGSLWTISVEIQFYLLTPIIYFFLKRNKWFIYLLFIISICINIYIKLFPDWSKLMMKLLSVSFLPWVFMFLTGYFFSYYKSIPKFIGLINIWIILSIYIVSMFTIGGYHNNAMNSINPISSFILSCLIIRIAQVSIKLPTFLASFIDNNDLSYGVYIYHMPIINYFLFTNIFSTYTNIYLTILFTFMLAYLSWRLIEKPSLSLKK